MTGRSGGRPPRVAIWGHYHGGNLGDEVVVSTIAANLRRRLPSVSLVGVSQSPRDTEERHGMPALPLRWAAERLTSGGPPQHPTGSKVKERLTKRSDHRGVREARRLAARVRDLGAEAAFLRRSLQRLDDIDLIVVAGSGPVSDDWRGPWSHPYTIFKWSLLARLKGVPFAFLGVGAGPIDHRLSRYLLAGPLRWAAFRSVRDEASADLVRGLGVRGPMSVVPDLAISLPVPDGGWPRPGATDGQVRVGLNPIPYMDRRYWPAVDDERYAAYVAKVADYAEWVLTGGRRLVFVYSQTGVDPLVCDDVLALLAERLDPALLEQVERPLIDTVDDLLEALAGCDYVVAGRFHCILLPYLIGRPAIGMSYHAKTDALMDYMGQSDLCFDVDAFSAADLVSASQRVEQSTEDIGDVVGERLPALRATLSDHYEHLIDTVGLARDDTTQRAFSAT
ncbi:hypothetical protein GCM10022415_31630 [Knoellia locipacati]|uniref:Polysaccharide pyruvyl transferase domain-containing protein n=1 Tax=Knoellia locipacati TaxID=882824 RepID=A0A512T3U3_9MICO|nr:polysaccharide pyruvyl transferase family protein [Knoellia locipacati]GEQ14833.1 hypothetical protein KLO01_28800 [Knoellia locipacati]